jgi:mannosyltransferase
VRPALARRAVGLIRSRSPELLVTAAAAVLFGWRVGTPGPWRDEGATWLAAGRSLPDLLDLTRHVDLVHLSYYLLVHLLLTADGSLTAPRWLSVAAMAAAAGVLVSIGRRLGSVRIGVGAGLLLIAAPLASRYGQEARPYALAALAATVATRALVSALAASGPRARRRAWAGYALSVVLLGAVNVLALLVLSGHAPAALRRPGARRPWAVATGAALLALAPFLVATSRQRGQVGWLHRPAPADLLAVLSAPYDGWLLPALGLVLATVAVLRRPGPSDADDADDADDAARAGLLLGAGWGLLPPVLLWLVSQAHPLFDGRYLVAALPGLALALAVTSASLPTPRRDQGIRRSVAVLAPALVLALAGGPAQLRYRDRSTGHTEDVRAVVSILTGEFRPGDAVLFVPWHLRIVTQMYPDPARMPDDVALGAGPVPSGTLTGTDLPTERLPRALAGYGRVWLVTGPAGLAGATGSDAVKARLLGSDYRLISRMQAPSFRIALYLSRQA